MTPSIYNDLSAVEAFLESDSAPGARPITVDEAGSPGKYDHP